MSRPTATSDAGAMHGGGVGHPAPLGGTLLARFAGAMQAYRQIFGIPDYERYLEHMVAHHPGAPLMTRREFCAYAIERKYAKRGPRCC